MTRTILLAGAAALTFGGTALAQAGASPDTTTTSQPTAAAGPVRATTPPAAESATSDAMPAADAMQSDSPADASTGSSAANATAPSAAEPADAAQAADSSSAQPSMSGQAPAASASATDMAAPAAAAPTQTAQAPSGAVQAEWANYDKGNKGSLTPLEFGKWVMAANGQDVSSQVDRTQTSRQANLPAVKVLNATASAFDKADSNNDRRITPDELTSFLQG